MNNYCFSYMNKNNNELINIIVNRIKKYSPLSPNQTYKLICDI